MRNTLLLLLLLVAGIQADAQIPSCGNLNVATSPAPIVGQPLRYLFTNNTPPSSGKVDKYSMSVKSTGSITWSNAFTNSTNFTTYYYDFVTAGSYDVRFILERLDSATMTTLCIDTMSFVVNASVSPCLSTFSYVKNPNGSIMFTANNIGGGTGLVYSWYFGDGNGDTGTTVTHMYANTGTYNVIFIATGNGCMDSSSQQIPYFNGVLNCSNLYANFTISSNATVVSFFNTSTNVTVPGATIQKIASWDFGDGSPLLSGNNSPVHTYAVPGIYTVTLYNSWIDSSKPGTPLCQDTFSNSITVMGPPNVIGGEIFWDSTLLTLPTQGSFKVWLIHYDSATQMLTAVDSTFASGSNPVNYSFVNQAADSYRVKAAVVNGTSGATVLAPTYHYSSLYWNAAGTFQHNGGTTTGKDIFMQTGSMNGGPGFIGGNVSAGANKGTNGSAVANLLILLRSATGDLQRFTYTDANGDYAFGNIPTGVYMVYPEAMNYITIPYDSVKVISGQLTRTGINFKQTPMQIKPIATGIDHLPEAAVFSIQPNPTDGPLILNWSSAEARSASIMVLDVTGRTMMHLKVSTTSPTRLNLGGLEAGIYFIKAVTERGQHVERIVVQ